MASRLGMPKKFLVSFVTALAMVLGAVTVGPVPQPEVAPRAARRCTRRRQARRRKPREKGQEPAPVRDLRPRPEGALFTLPGSPARPFAEALAWLWRLGPVGDAPSQGTIGVGYAAEAQELAARVRERRSAGAIVLAPDAGAAAGPVPARRHVSGVARFHRDAAVRDTFAVFERGDAVVRTRLGTHAIREGPLLVIGADPVANWGRLSAFWALEPIQAYLLELLERPLVQLPPLGCLRFDDLPGTIYMQLEGSDKGDAKSARRIDRLRRTCKAAGAKLNLAVAARGLAGGRHVPTEQVWPRGIEAIRRGIQEGVFEIVCHGLLHYDERAHREDGILDPREFRRLDHATAARHLDLALEWDRRVLGSPRSFVAPAWGYSEGALRAAAERDLPAWHRAAPEPLILDGNPRETLIGAGGIGGVHGVAYGSLVRLAATGVPPTPVLHGLSLDDRSHMPPVRDAVSYARLALRRDALRLPRVRGLRWVGAGELIEHLRAHDQVGVEGAETRIPDGAEAVLVTREGRQRRRS